MTSFNSIALNGSTLSVNGTDYNLSLSQTAEGTDSSLSSFKGVAAVDNGDGTISLTVGENSVVVEKYEEQPSVLQYLTFSSPSSFTLGVVDNQKYWDGTLKYSTDGTTWTTWSGTSAISSASDGTKHNLYLCGIGNTYITGSSASDSIAKWVLTGSDISCDGNIESLLDYQTVESGQHPTMADKCYSYMFSGCTGLTTAPSLPATTLTTNCYSYMFKGCTSLTTAPSLPATTLYSRCYQGMFSSCTGLTTAPSLPATTLATYCYSYMFSNCTSLTTAPSLPATTLATNCYTNMFNRCIGLTTAPSLPATTLATYCYFSMFSNCTSLTTAPSLHATTLATYCYQAMFSGCTSLTTAPSLPATTLYLRCYQEMFKGCTSLKLSRAQIGSYQYAYRIPTSGTGTTASYAVTDMFTNTGGTFTGTPTINTTYYTDHQPV